MPRYTAYYCEENIWHLCAERRGAGLASTVLLVTNPDRRTVLFQQRAADPGQPIVWDYHVILLSLSDDGTWLVWDLDTRLAMPLPFPDYAALTFAPPGVLAPSFEPRFRVIDGGDWLAGFSSDRSHMRKKNGLYRAPPPPWPVIVVPGAPSFLSWLDEDAAGPGQWMSLRQLLTRFQKAD